VCSKSLPFTAIFCQPDKANATKPTAEEIEGFYEANRHNFPRPEMFHASHIVKYVNHEQSEEQAEAGIEVALAELERGEPFAEVANRHSDCKDKGGDLGKFPAGHMVEDFEEVIRELEPGERSDIFTTPFGFHIALLHGRIPAGLATLEEVREAIERVMTFARQHDAYLRVIGEMRSLADIRWVPGVASAAG
jgi:parvulin-like peptidyl-prolyl isomerase